MKRIISLLLCIVMVCALLVSCGESEIGSYLENYPETDNTVHEIKLNMYIISDDSSAQNAEETVRNLVNQYTMSKFKTNLVLHFVSEDEYRDTVLNSSKSDDANAANIVLVNSYALFKELYDAKLLCDLTDYYNSREYGKLNKEISSALINGSKISDKLYSVPNDNVIGSYDYLVISKIARDVLHYSDSTLATYRTLDDCKSLVEDMKNAGYNPDELIYTANGPFEMKAEIEAKGNFCNVAKYPTVDYETAFSSAFVIINRESAINNRAMQVIYEIQNPENHELRNLLQYGVEGTNYSVDENGYVVRVTEGDNAYKMNIHYTGNVFHALFCEEYGWIESVKNNGKNQNAQAVYVNE